MWTCHGPYHRECNKDHHPPTVHLLRGIHAVSHGGHIVSYVVHVKVFTWDETMNRSTVNGSRTLSILYSGYGRTISILKAECVCGAWHSKSEDMHIQTESCLCCIVIIISRSETTPYYTVQIKYNIYWQLQICVGLPRKSVSSIPRVAPTHTLRL